MTHPSERVGRYFNEKAPVYDENMQRQGWPGTDILAEELAEWSVEPRRVLDLGAGTGAALEAITERTNPERIVAVDASHGMLDRLRKKYTDPKIYIAWLAISDYLADTKETFDLVVAMAVLHFVPNTRDTIGSVALRLNQGGRFMFTYDPIIADHPAQSWAESPVPEGDFSVYRQHPDEIIDVVQDSGLAVVKERQFLPKPAVDPTYRTGFIVVEKQ